MRFLTAFLAFLCFSFPAAAQDLPTLLDIPPGQSLVNLSATERVEVDQDLLIANLQYEARNASSTALQDEINKTMSKAVETAKKVDSVKISTGSYYVYQYDPDPQSPRNALEWRGSQSLQIKGKQADELLELVADLQEQGLSMQGLSYAVSPELMEETQNNMLEAALGKLKTKAERTAKALGKDSADLLNINVDIGGGVMYGRPMMARAEMAMDSAVGMKMAAPVAEPGQSDITLTVSATALLK
ncbi:MAG: SIMPL domain-containing protein [Alphaproteobacteria bacterium]|nr:SIMPL domain-containing protein [Alphaproteobacteria bacterium]MCD8525656.1 SIMPL domain-containing protein [Alphaproteobacteria bacterium]MCD8570034.1 SIMPL domain-containing protein [Alphaproteobacteria bacterium]